MMSIVNDCEKTSDLGESAITSDDANIVTFNEKDSTIENSPEERCSSQGSTEMIAPQKLACEMCHNYETTLTKLQETERELKEKLAAAQHLADRYQTELSGERVYRNELESKMTTLSMEAEADRKKAFRENDELSKKLERVEKRLEKLKEEQNNKLDILKEQFSEMDRNMQYLSRKYIKLLGTQRKCAAELREQVIDLPEHVDQLQVLCLSLQEELIETRSAREHMEECLNDEIALLRTEQEEGKQEKLRQQRMFAERLNGISEQLAVARSQVSSFHDESQRRDGVDKKLAESTEKIEDLEKQVSIMKKEKAELEMTADLYRQRCAALQQELDTSEAVQKDFVKLSQNLQIELEKIRQSEQEARWQFEEDVNSCNQCKNPFNKNKSKIHCMHCGKIFCSQCLQLTVPSGPHGRLAKVCEVCHTLLSRDAPPFFSKCSEKS